MKLRIPRLASLAAAFLFPTASMAEIIVGGDIGIGDIEGYSDVKAGTAYRSFAGYRAADYPLFAVDATEE